MNDTWQNGFGVTAEEISRYDWEARLEGASHKECRFYWSVLSDAAAKCGVAGDDVGQRVYTFLAAVSSFLANFDARGNPYVAMGTWVDGSHSLCAEDFAETDLLALRGIVETIVDPEFRARVADVLWVRKKDFKLAQIAVHAFLASAQRLKEGNLAFPHIERLKRAAQICANKGFEPEQTLVLSSIESAIDEFLDDEKPDYVCHGLMSILLMIRQGDPTKYAALSERIASACAKKDEWGLAEEYWQLATQWHQKGKREDDIKRCRLSAAECNISRGEDELKKQGSMSAAHWYGRGVEALRRAKADPEKIKAAHRRFLELEKLGLKEMKPLDLGLGNDPEFQKREKETQEKAAEFVQGLDFHKAVERFAHVTLPVDFEELKKKYLEASKGTIASKLFGSVVLDHTGKVADSIPPDSLLSDEKDPESLRKQLCQQAARVDWPVRVIWVIEPARMTILDEHPVTQQGLLYLVVDNPFIPQGHEGIYLRGLQAGFLGDWLVAMHLLVPQIETSIRLVLQQRGVVTSTLVDGIQQERDLNQLLWLPDVEKIFGVNVLFDLRGILIERFGYNLRNQLAHGLLPEGGFYREASAYLWWLVLRLCWMGFRLAHLSDEEIGKA